MRRLRILSVGVIIGVGLALTACSSGSDSSDSGAGKVGVILPDTKSSVRWESKDRPALEAAFQDAGVDYTIQNAEGKLGIVIRIRTSTGRTEKCYQVHRARWATF